MEPHHMLSGNGADILDFRRKLVEIGPILDQLAQVGKVVWLHQYPTIERYGETNAHNTDIFTEKIRRYNEVVHQEFKLVFFLVVTGNVVQM